jgi:hypothetical protein
VDGLIHVGGAQPIILFIFIIIFIPTSHPTFLRAGGMKEDRWGMKMKKMMMKRMASHSPA